MLLKSLTQGESATGREQSNICSGRGRKTERLPDPWAMQRHRGRVRGMLFDRVAEYGCLSVLQHALLTTRRLFVSCAH